MKNKNSERHHYLPEFFLKEFTDDDGFFFVYDKENDKILKNRKSPKSVFFEWKRNTTKLEEKEFVWLEELYQKLDSDFSPLYKKLLELDYENISEHDRISNLLNLLLFVNFIRWRVPARDEITQNIYEKYKFGELSMQVVDKISGKIVENKEFEEFVKSQDIFRKGQASMIIFEPWHHFEILKDTIDRVILFTQDNHETLICDNPYLEESISDDVESFSEFFFPLSKKHFALYINNFNNKPLDSTFCYLFELAKFEQAKKYVASPSKEVLEYYSKEYQKNKHRKITQSLFKYVRKK